MSFCPHCGAQLLKESKFCVKCGGKLDLVPATEPAAEPTAEPAVQPQAPAETSAAPIYAQPRPEAAADDGIASAAKPKKRKTGAIIAVVLAVLLLAGAAVGAYFLLGNRADPMFVGNWQVADGESAEGRRPAAYWFGADTALTLNDDGTGTAVLGGTTTDFKWKVKEGVIKMTAEDGSIFAEGSADGEDGRLDIELAADGETVPVRVVKEGGVCAQGIRQELDVYTGTWDVLYVDMYGDRYTPGQLSAELFCLTINADGTALLELNDQDQNYTWYYDDTGMAMRSAEVPTEPLDLYVVEDEMYMAFTTAETVMDVTLARRGTVQSTPATDVDTPEIVTDDAMIASQLSGDMWVAATAELEGVQIDMALMEMTIDATFYDDATVYVAVNGEGEYLNWEVVDGVVYIREGDQYMSGVLLADGTLLMTLEMEGQAVTFYMYK